MLVRAGGNTVNNVNNGYNGNNGNNGQSSYDPANFRYI